MGLGCYLYLTTSGRSYGLAGTEAIEIIDVDAIRTVFMDGFVGLPKRGWLFGASFPLPIIRRIWCVKRTWYWCAESELAALRGEANMDVYRIRFESLNSIANLTTRAKNKLSLFAKRVRSASSEAVGP